MTSAANGLCSAEITSCCRGLFDAAVAPASALFVTPGESLIEAQPTAAPGADLALEGAAAAKCPAAAIQSVQQRHPLLAGMRQYGGEPLASAGVFRRSRSRDLLAGGAIARCRGYLWRRRNPVSAGNKIVVYRCAILHGGAQLQPGEAGLVAAGGLLTVGAAAR